MKALLLSGLAAALLGAGCGGEAAPTSLPSPLPPPEPLPGCDDLTLEVAFLGRNEGAATTRGALTVEAADPAVALDFVRPYAVVVPVGGANLDLPGLSPTVGVFVSDLRFTAGDEGIRQTMSLEWLGELEVRASASDCRVVASCDGTGCISGPGAPPTGG